MAQKLDPKLSRVSFSSFDDILSSLDFLDAKVKRGPRTPVSSPKVADYPTRPLPPATPSLDPGVEACAKCGAPIGNERLDAEGKPWHPSCFACHLCGKFLTGSYFPKSGNFYCLECAEKQNPCAQCGKPIPAGTKYSVNSEGKNYHTECASKKKICCKCDLPITDVEIFAADKYFHPACFKCAECGTQLEGKFINVNGNPVCSACRINAKPKCEVCRQPILTTFTEFQGKLRHTECFVCAKCKVELGMNPFYDVAGQPLCSSCGAI